MAQVQVMEPLENMCMLDRFLFAEAMEDPWIHEYILKTIFQREIQLRWIPETEKEVRNHPNRRSIRLDGWVMDKEGRAYNTEVQKKDTGNLRRRSRLYQGTVDRSLLSRGIRDFNQLPDCFWVMIMPFDLLGEKRYRYTFRQCCRETGQPLEDGAVRIFLNTQGENPEEISPELIELLNYMEQGKVLPGSSKNICKLHEKITQIKQDKETGVRYMQAWEELEMMREEGRREGKEEGRREGKEEGRREGKEEGRREGKEEGRREGACAIVRICTHLGMNAPEILRYIEADKSMPQETKNWAKEALDTAELVKKG